jgi:hypothetical protein
MYKDDTIMNATRAREHKLNKIKSNLEKQLLMLKMKDSKERKEAII